MMGVLPACWPALIDTCEKSSSLCHHQRAWSNGQGRPILSAQKDETGVLFFCAPFGLLISATVIKRASAGESVLLTEETLRTLVCGLVPHCLVKQHPAAQSRQDHQNKVAVSVCLPIFSCFSIGSSYEVVRYHHDDLHLLNAMEKEALICAIITEYPRHTICGALMDG
jgi:hypothetical protein